jgi:hypothetical protein
VNFNKGERTVGWAIGRQRLEQQGIHSSESAWVGGAIDVTIDNDGTIDDLFNAIKSQVSNPPDASERPLYVGLSDSLHIQS